mmetsp:Transcript_23438/g.49547  ORF Transcript_23438/g.49547 Transcript_23438/m.49547 type:complete len:86 (-) Transcript_23438:277-534(-)
MSLGPLILSFLHSHQALNLRKSLLTFPRLAQFYLKSQQQSLSRPTGWNLSIVIKLSDHEEFQEEFQKMAVETKDIRVPRQIYHCI